MTSAAAAQTGHDRIAYLRQAVADHSLWLQTGGKDGRRANFSGQDLSGIVLSGVFLTDANFRAANLTGTDLSGAQLQGADFCEAILEHTNFQHARLEGANFSRCQSNSAYFDHCVAVEANFANAMLEGASAKSADFTGAKFRDAVVARTNFTASTMMQANMRYSKAHECVFDSVDLTGADCRDCIFDYTRFQNAEVTGANMRGASFEHVMFTDTDFSGALDLDSRYQSESIEMEKLSIRKEIENLYSVKEEVSQYEHYINSQKKDLKQKRKALESLNELETEISGALINYMKLFRQIAMFWFVVVSAFVTIIGYYLININPKVKNHEDMAVASAILLVILMIHTVSAAVSFKTAKKFARYVRLRRETLDATSLVSFPEDAEMPENDPSAAKDGVTYL